VNPTVTGVAHSEQVCHVIATAAATQLDVMDVLSSALADGNDPSLAAMIRSGLHPFLRLQPRPRLGMGTLASGRLLPWRGVDAQGCASLEGRKSTERSAPLQGKSSPCSLCHHTPTF
jgi:hypothetical protein